MTIRTMITTTATPPLLLPFAFAVSTTSSDPLSLLSEALSPLSCPSVVALLVVAGSGEALKMSYVMITYINYMLYYITYLIYYFICLSDLRDNFSGIGIDLNKVRIVILLSSSILINTFESHFLTIIDVHPT